MELYCRLFLLLATHQTTNLPFLNLKFLILRDLMILSHNTALWDMEGPYLDVRILCMLYSLATNLYSSLLRSHKLPTALLELHRTIRE